MTGLQVSRQEFDYPTVDRKCVREPEDLPTGEVA